MTTTKVFVGNLSFKTKEEELRTEFEAAGKVVNANIITRGPRSLGYGFVELENETVAKKAVELLHKKEIDGRQINVEIAKPREDEGEGEGEENGGFQQQSSGSPRGGRGGSRGTFTPRGRGGFRGTRGASRGTFTPRGRGRGSFVPRSTRPVSDAERVPSKTTLFVANLPFSFTDEAFQQVFTDIGLKPKSVKVVTKPNGRSKGFGFVEFGDEDSQKKALEKINGKEVEGRELTVRIALTDESSDGVKTDKPPVQKEEKKDEKN